MERWLADFETWLGLLMPPGRETEAQVKEILQATRESIESVRAASGPPIEWYARPLRSAPGNASKEADL
jgi:hypothetical protein